jgi:hypothetical protein
VPKESKKFINPLLRPSQEVEVKGEPLTRLQRSPASEAPVLEDFGVVEEIGTAGPEKSPFQMETPSKQEPSPVPLTAKTSTETETYTSTETSPVLSGNTQEKLFREGRKKSVSVPDRASVAYINDSNSQVSVDSQREDAYSTSRPRAMLSPAPAPYSETFGEPLPRASSTITPTSTNTYTPTSTSTDPPFSRQTFVQATPPILQTVPVDREQEENQERPSFRAAESVRRKKGPLAFEKTHERITIWIDKGLKQAFEELALDRELPKTALLNEAMADLLRKYGM